MWNVLVWTAQGKGYKQQVPFQRNTSAPGASNHIPTSSDPVEFGMELKILKPPMNGNQLIGYSREQDRSMSMVWSTSTKTWSNKAAQHTWHSLWQRPCMFCMSLSWKYKGPNDRNSRRWWAWCPRQFTRSLDFSHFSTLLPWIGKALALRILWLASSDATSYDVRVFHLFQVGRIVRCGRNRTFQVNLDEPISIDFKPEPHENSPRKFLQIHKFAHITNNTNSKSTSPTAHLCSRIWLDFRTL